MHKGDNTLFVLQFLRLIMIIINLLLEFSIGWIY